MSTTKVYSVDRNHVLTGVLTALLVVGLAVPAGFAAEPQIKAGDKIVVLHDTHMQAGDEKLAPIQAGTVLVAGEVRGEWVAVSVVQNGKTITGWTSNRQLVTDPRQAFTKLACGRDVPAAPKAQEFARLDKDEDGLVTADEFAAKTKSQTLDDLNEQLNGLINRGRDHMFPVHFMEQLRTFSGWTAPLSADQFSQLQQDFFTTRDIRRSSLAQELVDREDSKGRAQRAQALFKWADKNHDGKLTLEEFKQALPPGKEKHGRARGKPPAPISRSTSLLRSGLQ
jgi:Ca2+-binding EF-hand superfamily protein